MLNQHLAQRGIAFARGLTGEFILFSASTLVYQASRLGVSLAVARWAGPDEFGVWNALNLLLLYGVLVSLGVPNGMNRDVPLLTGKGERDKAEQVANFSFLFVLFSSLVASLGVSLIAMSGFVSAEYRPALFWMGLLFFSWQIYQYFQWHLKCHIQFHFMSMQQFAFALLLPVVVLPLAYWWRVPGFIAGQAVTALVLSYFIFRMTSFRINFSWRWEYFIPLVKIGFPIMAAGLLYSLLTTVDRWVILSYLGTEALGHYTLAILCLSVLSLLPGVVAQQMYPRMAFQYGQTGEKSLLLPLVIRQSLMATAVTVPVLAVVYISLPFLVEQFLPAYRLGIEPARILLLGLAFIPLAGGMGNFLNTVNKQLYYLAVQAAAVVINFGLNMMFVKMGWGLNGVATGAAISYAGYAVTLIGVGIWILKKGSEA